MNLSTSETPDVVLVAEDHTVIISDKVGVNFKCTRCGGTKDFYSHDANRDLEWMQTCTCKKYDTVPLSPDQLPKELRTPDMQSFDLPADVVHIPHIGNMPVHARLVNRERRDEA